MTLRIGYILGASAFALTAGSASADQVIADDLIVQGSACIGIDCSNGESFGFDTIRLKENNLRIKAQDTSASASFPSNDWQITFNDSSNGGANKFSIDDIDAGRTPFTIEGGSIANALYVSDAGDVGIGTATPVVEVHAVDGNTPTLRLEQNGSSGFTAQTWDLAGNEANFFIRDVTNGSKLPFKIKPGAPDNALFVAADGDVGLGTQSPNAPLELLESANNAASQPHLLVNNTSTTAGNRRMIGITNNGGAFIHMENRSSGAAWAIVNANTGTDFLVNDPATANVQLRLSQAGDLTIAGQLTTAGSCSVGCDRVFEDGYEILPIDERMALMWENGYLPNVGPTDEDGPFNVSDKMGRMLNELEHAHIYIGQLNARIAELERKIDG